MVLPGDGVRFDSKAIASDDILDNCLTSAEASPGTEVFQGFTQHISKQIGKDKQAFAQADACTAWFYKQMGKTPPPAAEAEKIHFVPISQSNTDADCAKQYPNGLEAAREAFGQTQQR
jgi:hypothetical protein